MDWASLDASVLRDYRHTQNLNTPANFTNAYNQRMLSRPGIGQMSPTMARQKDRRRVSKEHLATNARKDFNAAMIHEQEIVTSFLYSVQNQGMSDVSSLGV